MRSSLMSKLPLVLTPTLSQTKPDRAAQTRETYAAAHAMARRMLRPSPRYTVGARYGWCADALRARFGVRAWPVAQVALRAAYDRLMASRGYAGDLDQLQRQGLVDDTGRPVRCVSVERYAGAYVGWA